MLLYSNDLKITRWILKANIDIFHLYYFLIQLYFFIYKKELFDLQFKEKKIIKLIIKDMNKNLLNLKLTYSLEINLEK